VADSRDIPASGRIVAKRFVDGLGGAASVGAYYDEPEAHRIDVLTCRESPQQGWMTCATVSLHLARNLVDGTDIRVELMATASDSDTALPNMLATAAFNVTKDGWLAAPGVVFPDLVRMYFTDTTTPHVMWSEPFNIQGLSTIAVAGFGEVHCLLAVPLSDAEVRYLHTNGFDRLEERLVERSVEYFDLRRESTV
jgi:antitoxin YqcF